MERAGTVVEELRRELALRVAEREELRARVQRLVERYGDDVGDPQVQSLAVIWTD